MMKYWLALLVLLNALVLAWQLNAFAPWGFGPHQDREPERLGQQIKPEALQFERVLPQPVAEPAETMAPDAQPLPGAVLSSDPVDGLGSAGAAEGANTSGQGAQEVQELQGLQGVQEGVQGATSPAGAAPNSVLPVSPVLASPSTALPAQPTVPVVGSGQVN